MRLSFSSLLILAAFVAGASSRADDLADIPPPKPPLVAALPDSLDWTITIKQAGAQAPSLTPTAGKPHPAAHLVEVHTTVSGKLRRDIISDSDGHKVTHWIVDSMVFWTNQQGQVSVSDLHMAPALDANDPDPTSPTGFPGMHWLGISFYDKAVAVGKRHAYHYVHGENEAWVDTETNLPVAYKNQSVFYSYSFGDPLTEPLKLPPDFQQAYNKMQQMITRRRLLQGGSVTYR